MGKEHSHGEKIKRRSRLLAFKCGLTVPLVGTRVVPADH